MPRGEHRSGRRPVPRLTPTVRIAARNLERSRARSALAGLGIAVGVLAIVSIGVLGVGVRGAVLADVGDVGDRIVVTPAGGPTDGLTPRELTDIRRAVDESAVVPVKRGVTLVSTESRRRRVGVYGMERPDSLYEARMGTIPEPLRNGALVGSRLAETLDVEAGGTIAVGGDRYRVRAVLARPALPPAVNPIKGVVVPESEVDSGGYASAVVVAESVHTASVTADAIDDALNGRRERVEVTKLAERIDRITDLFDAVNAFVVGVGAISMLVAGMGILNVQLMSAVERRDEVALLRAVGYRKRDVLTIFLAEAALLGLVGTALGVLLALGIAVTVDSVAAGGDLTLATAGAARYVLLGIGFGVGTSLLGSLYPAWRAANERPVEALGG